MSTSAAEAQKYFQNVPDTVCDIVERPWRKMPTAWYVGPAVPLSMGGVLRVAWTWLVLTGVSSWGNNNSEGWAWDITSFVFWIGIGHAGTLISAILFLMRQKWRTSINRAAEAMTIFA